MSTKDLIERLNRTAKTRTTRKSRSGSSKTTRKTESGEVQTRVGARVIRRRKVRKKKDASETRSKLAGLSSGGDKKKSTKKKAAASGKKKADQKAVQAKAAQEAATEPVEAKAEAPPEEPAATEEEEAVQADTATVQSEEAAAASEDTESDDSAAAQPDTEPQAAEPEAEDSAEASEAEEATEPEAAEPEAAEPEAAEPEAAEPQEEAAEAEAAEPEEEQAEATADEEEAEVEASADEEKAKKDEEESEDSAARSIASSLPRADGSRPNAPDKEGSQPLPGLGAGVIAPPPGYDPTNPTAFRKQVKEKQAQEKAKEEKGGSSKVWRDQRNSPGSSGRSDRSKSRRGGSRRRRRRRGRVDLGRRSTGRRVRSRRRRRRSGPKKKSPKPAAHKRRVDVPGSITVADLAHGMSVKSTEVIKKLIAMGTMATQNDTLDFDTAEVLAQEFDYEVVNTAFQEEEHLIEFEEEEEDLEIRPPVVTVMGHVDHGKTTLLDAIRNARVAAGEAGGITQHVSAYQIERNDELITFIDTPGHAAFTAMRARGAEVTDIVVLVVAADDGVMPQTVEVINHAKAAGVQIIVAVNKIDKADAQPERVRQQLMEHELIPEDYGGDTLFVNTSALKGEGIDELLDSILLISEIQEYSANPDRHAEGTVIEGRLEKGKGSMATLLVQHGTLKRRDTVVVGTTWGRIRALTDHTGQRIKEAGPSTPVEIMGLNDVPEAGDNMVVVANEKDAKTLVEHRAEIARQDALAKDRSGVSLEDLLARQKQGELLSLNLIIKADVGGSLEALKGSFDKIDVEGTDIKILHSAVGAVTESDITLAHTNDAVIMAFNVRPDSKARRAMDGYGVEVRTYSVIYEAIEDVEKALKGMLDPETKEVVQGTAEIRQTFGVPKVGTVAGCMVTEGKISRAHDIRLLRDGKIVWTGRLGSLRRFKDDVREVAQGYECGMNLDGFNDIKIGDIIEAFSEEEVEAVI